MFLFLSVCLQFFGVLLLLIMGLLEGATLIYLLGVFLNFVYSFYVIFVNDFLANICSDLFKF